MTWPTWTQLQQSTMIVLVATLLITVVVLIMDAAAGKVLNVIYKLYSKNMEATTTNITTENAQQQETKWFVLAGGEWQRTQGERIP